MVGVSDILLNVIRGKALWIATEQPFRRVLEDAGVTKVKFITPINSLSSLRAKGTLIGEPRFSTPCEMQFFPREKGITTFVEGFSLKRPFSLSRVGKIASRRG